MGNNQSDIIRYEDKQDKRKNATERYTIEGDQVYEQVTGGTPQPLSSVIAPNDVRILQLAVLSNRLEWQGYEAKWEQGAWMIYRQDPDGLRRIKVVGRLSQAWLYLNNWTE